MINCVFENGSPASLRHVVVHAIVEKDGALTGFNNEMIGAAMSARLDGPGAIGAAD